MRHAKIGELTLENDFLEKSSPSRDAERKEMIDRNHPLSISQQAKAVGINRGSVYSLPRPVSDYDLELMRQIDRLPLEYPFAESRMRRDLPRQNGLKMKVEFTYKAGENCSNHRDHL